MQARVKSEQGFHRCDGGCRRDTSRSGWKAVNNGRPIDGRKKRGNWCNAKTAGMGQPPRANPVASLPIDAFA